MKVLPWLSLFCVLALFACQPMPTLVPVASVTPRPTVDLTSSDPTPLTPTATLIMPTSTPTAIPTTPTPPACPATSQIVDNLTAFARLYGIVRYFHPSSECAKLDWNRFIKENLNSVMAASDTDDLIARLRAVFLPYAPTVQVFRTGERFALHPALQPPERLTESHLVMWEHHGVAGKNLTGYTGYSSTRHCVSLEEGKVPPDFFAPADVYDVELGPGVSAAVPLTLYADADGVTWPHSDGDGPDVPVPTCVDVRTILHLADVIVTWNIFQHFYPYFDVVQCDWSQALVNTLHETLTLDKRAVFRHTLQRLVAHLHDGHSNVYDPQPAWFKPGIDLAWVEDHLAVIAASGEDVAPLQPGDIVLGVGTQTITQTWADIQTRVTTGSPQHQREIGVLELLLGRQGTTLTLKVATQAQGVQTLALSRRIQFGTPLVASSPPLEEVAPGIWYVDLSQMDDTDFEAALPQLAAAQGIIIDVREYPMLGYAFLGHFSDSPLASPPMFIPILTMPDYKNVVRYDRPQWEIAPRTPRLTAPVVFLSDGGTFSYGETLMSIVAHYDLGEIVGTATAGTNGNVNYFVTPGTYMIAWTGMKVLNHDGSQHHGIGILPTHWVTPTLQGVREQRDELLEYAVHLLSQP